VKYDVLPVSLLNLGCNLSDLGVYEIAWKFHEALKVIRSVSAHGYIVLGGDVYRMDRDTGRISSTGDNWYSDDQVLNDGVAKSAAVAEEYVRRYHARNGDGFLYSIVFRPTAMPTGGTYDSEFTED